MTTRSTVVSFAIGSLLVLIAGASVALGATTPSKFDGTYRGWGYYSCSYSINGKTPFAVTVTDGLFEGVEISGSGVAVVHGLRYVFTLSGDTVTLRSDSVGTKMVAGVTVTCHTRTIATRISAPRGLTGPMTLSGRVGRAINFGFCPETVTSPASCRYPASLGAPNPLYFSIVTGAGLMPRGLKLSSDGTLSGTLQSQPAPRTYHFRVCGRELNSDTCTVSHDVTFNVSK